MQKRIWSQYNQNLVQRGSTTFYLDIKALRLIKNFRSKSTGGRPKVFPLMLIHILIMLKIQYSLPYRALEGFARSIFKWLTIPTYSLICKRAKDLGSLLPKLVGPEKVPWKKMNIFFPKSPPFSSPIAQ